MSTQPAAEPVRLRVLFADDQESIRETMAEELPVMGHEATVCADGAEAIAAIDKQRFDAAIIDLRMPHVDGWGVVEHLRKVSPETEFVIATGHGDMEEAIRALREGAYDFLPKPTRLFEIGNVLTKIAEKKALNQKAEALAQRCERAEGKSDLVGDGPAMARVKKMIAKIAPTDSAVLILGETGTGKEMVARRVHEESLRCGRPFVAVNCGALPEHLVESEFFGHKKGAFTGAERDRKGLFEVADGGTLFLDELGELDKSMQVKLLRFLESGEIRRVGENEAFRVDVRIVCATNRDLRDMVADGSFREDLIFRINTFELHLPPLRERVEDIGPLAEHLIARHMKRHAAPAGILPEETRRILEGHRWTGNVRELANALEHAVILCEDEVIRPEDLPRHLVQGGPLTLRVATGTGGESRGDAFVGVPLRDVEREVILATLRAHDGDKPATAKVLGIALKTLYNKLNQYEAARAA